MADEVLDDHTGFGQHQGFRGFLRPDSQNGGLAKRMDFFQLRRCHLVYSFVCFELIFKFELFQKP